MSKRIVLCSDGTGNAEGKNAGTNVFKTYKAIARHGVKEQIGFYDNGVGTEKRKIFRAIGGAFGFGFAKNVKDLYTFLARTYKHQDRDEVYLFGFSRGAATVRAFAGFLNACGLVDLFGREDLDRKQQEDLIDQAFNAYRKGREAAAEFKKNHCIRVPIKFIGVWDTVSALGFPKDLGLVIDVLEKVANKVFPHSFYDFELNPDIENVCHALALDDERRSFEPILYDEKSERAAKTNVEQVWFAGMHSNVGGGYPRQGMSNCTLQWMMDKAAALGLEFKPGRLEEISQDADDTGRMYDSRAGTGVYYRLQPRDPSALSRGKTDRIRIHHSVLHRIERGTAGYAPGNLPASFDVVDENGGRHPSEEIETLNLLDYRGEMARADGPIRSRQGLHSNFIMLSLLAVALAVIAGWRAWPLPTSWPVIMEIATCASLLGCALLLRSRLPKWIVWGSVLALLGVAGSSIAFWFPQYSVRSPVGWVLTALNEVASWFAPSFLEATITLALETYAGVTSFLLFLLVWIWTSTLSLRETCERVRELARKALRRGRPELFAERESRAANKSTGS
jgi:uncharacterized protein (DUF2235 family)